MAYHITFYFVSYETWVIPLSLPLWVVRELLDRKISDSPWKLHAFFAITCLFWGSSVWRNNQRKLWCKISTHDHHCSILLAEFQMYTFCPFWSGIGYGFRGNYGSVWRYLLFQFQMNKKETIRNGFDEFVCLRSNLSNEKHNFYLKARSENEYGF